MDQSWFWFGLRGELEAVTTPAGCGAGNNEGPMTDPTLVFQIPSEQVFEPPNTSWAGL